MRDAQASGLLAHGQELQDVRKARLLEAAANRHLSAHSPRSSRVDGVGPLPDDLFAIEEERVRGRCASPRRATRRRPSGSSSARMKPHRHRNARHLGRRGDPIGRPDDLANARSPRGRRDSSASRRSARSPRSLRNLAYSRSRKRAIGRLHLHDETALEARPQALLETRELARRAIARE